MAATTGRERHAARIAARIEAQPLLGFQGDPTRQQCRAAERRAAKRATRQFKPTPWTLRLPKKGQQNRHITALAVVRNGREKVYHATKGLRWRIA